MDIKRLVSWAYSVDEIPNQIQRNTIARQRYIEKNIPEDTVELSEKVYAIGQGRFLSYQMGGIVGPLSTLMSQDRSISTQERIRVCSIACEAAARVGLAFEFTPLRQSYTALTEAIFTIGLVEKKDRQTVEKALEHSFSLACVGDWSLYPGMLMRACLSLAEQLFRAPLASGFGILPPASLPISSLYQNHTWVGATQVLSAHPVPLVLQTAVQSVNEVLQRHLKAAGKRLRMDQVQEIRLFMPTVNPVFLRGDVSTSSQAIGLSLPWTIALLVGMYSLENSDREEWFRSHRVELYRLVRRIRIIEEPLRWLPHWKMKYECLGGVYGAISKSELQSQIQKECRFERSSLRLWKALGQWRHLPSNRVDEFAFQFPIRLNLLTTRGGRWPEERLVPEDGVDKD